MKRRVRASEKTRKALQELFAGRHGGQRERSDLVRLATRLIVEKPLERATVSINAATVVMIVSARTGSMSPALVVRQSKSIGDGKYRAMGVITDRDICMCELFQHKQLSELRVSDAMTKLACQPQDALQKAERIMRDTRIRRSLVLNPEGILSGIVALADLAREATQEDNLGARQEAEV